MSRFLVGILTCSPLCKPRLPSGYDIAIWLFLLLPLVGVSETQAQNFFYTPTGGTVTIFSYSGPGGDVTIPATIDGLPVTGIGSWQQVFPTNVTSVTIPNGVTNIGMTAFAGTGLSTLTIPDSVLSIGQNAFVSCTSLTNVLIGKGLTNLAADFAFYRCTNLMAITVDGENPAFRSMSGVLFNRSQTQLLLFPPRTTGTYDVPQGVTQIGRGAFKGSTGLTALTIPNSVTNIGYGAFQHCPSLTGIYFRGSSPSLDTGPIENFQQTPAVIYYLPGTAGWGVSFGGQPTALWTLPYPLILSSSPGFGAQSNQFSFTISWATNVDVVVEATTNRVKGTWQPIQTNALVGGASYFTDPQWTNYPSRFYRLRSP